MHKNKRKEIIVKAETDIWEKIKKRAKEIQKKSELLGKISDSEKEKIFKERADKLSRIEKKSDDGKDLIKIISFNIGNELYGIDIKYLNEVYEVDKITHIPCTPQVISGLINLRGGILTVLNLSSLLNPSAGKIQKELPEKKNNDLPRLSKGGMEKGVHKILIFGNGGIRAGIWIDSFGTLYELSKDSIQPVSSIFLERNKIIKHEFPINNASLWIIDVEELLNDERLIVNEDV
ncbi:MAG: chemotaxis protein CheW [Nitrospinae bacterium]|nr:chemotaxis protein CheW [Nitrospinota bacterium]